MTDEEAAAERAVLRVLAAAIAFLLASAAGVLVQRDDEGSPVPASLPAGPPAPSELGPPPGAVLAEYGRRQGRAVFDASGRRAAVVSFRRYVRATEAARLLEGTEQRALLVAAPGRAPQVTDDLREWAALERLEIEGELAELRRILPTVRDPAFVRQYRTDIGRLERSLATLEPRGEVVFGAVVVADADRLRAVARLALVRFVDVAAGAVPPPVVRGVRPEETQAAGVPRTRPLDLRD